MLKPERVEDEKLTARNGTSSDDFGHAVAIDTDVIVFGANGAGGRGDESGAAYVYEFP